MKLSMLLISERLKLDNCNYSLQHTQNSTFSEVMLFTHPSKFSKGILLISQGIPNDYSNLTPDSGLICCVPPDSYPQAIQQARLLPCDYLIISTTMTLSVIFNTVSQLFFCLRAQLDSFKIAAYTQQSLQTLMEMIYDVLGNPAYLVDSSFKVIAIDKKHDMRNLSVTWRRLEDEGYLSFELVSNLINSGELRIMEADKKAKVVNSKFFYVPFINYNLSQQGKIQGHLFIAGMITDILQSDIELLSYMGELVLHSMLQNPRFQNERGNYYEYFMRDMLNGKLNNKMHIRQQMQFLGYEPHDYYTVVVVHPSPEHGLSDERIASLIERCSGAKPIFHNEKIATLFSQCQIPDPASLVKKLEQIRDTLNCAIGVSDTFKGFYDLKIYYDQAEWALLSTKNKDKPDIRYYKNYVSQHVISIFSKQCDWKMLALPELLQLVENHELSKMDPLKTLYSFLLHERSILKTAEDLHIHRNTLAYRINRILELCDIDLDNIPTRQRLLLSLPLVLNTSP